MRKKVKKIQKGGEPNGCKTPTTKTTFDPSKHIRFEHIYDYSKLLYPELDFREDMHDILTTTYSVSLCETFPRDTFNYFCIPLSEVVKKGVDVKSDEVFCFMLFKTTHASTGEITMYHKYGEKGLAQVERNTIYINVINYPDPLARLQNVNDPTMKSGILITYDNVDFVTNFVKTHVTYIKHPNECEDGDACNIMG